MAFCELKNTLLTVIQRALIVCNSEPFIEICKISIWNTPDQSFIRSKEISDSVYDNFEQFFENQEI